MMCYKDKTFCPFYEDCGKGKNCKDAMTEKIINDAETFGLPISRWLDPPKCYKEKIKGIKK